MHILTLQLYSDSQTLKAINLNNNNSCYFQYIHWPGKSVLKLSIPYDYFFAQRPVVQPSLPVHFSLFLANTPYARSIIGLNSGREMNVPSQPKPTALYITVKAGTPRWICPQNNKKSHSGIINYTSETMFLELKYHTIVSECFRKLITSQSFQNY